MAKPCISCGGVKVPGPGQRYCGPCKEVRMRTVEIAPAATGERRLRVKAAPGHKWCSRCQQEKPLTVFRAGAYCVPCQRAKGVEARLRDVYSMTTWEYDAILEKQGGCCAICGMKPRTKRLHVDHDHKTMMVRGLLCSNCNSGVLASAKDSPDILRAAADYLEDPPSRRALMAPIYATEKANVKRRPRRGRGQRWNPGSLPT